MAKQDAVQRVREGQPLLTVEQAKVFLTKRAALKIEHGSGAEARANILEGFELTEEEQVFLLDFTLWKLFEAELGDADLVKMLSE